MATSSFLIQFQVGNFLSYQFSCGYKDTGKVEISFQQMSALGRSHLVGVLPLWVDSRCGQALGIYVYLF